MKYTDIDIKNISKIEFIQVALKIDSSMSNLDSIYLITLILDDYFNVATIDFKELYKLMLKEATDKETTLSDVFINIIYNYYLNSDIYLKDKKDLESLVNKVCDIVGE